MAATTAARRGCANPDRADGGGTGRESDSGGDQTNRTGGGGRQAPYSTIALRGREEGPPQRVRHGETLRPGGETGGAVRGQRPGGEREGAWQEGERGVAEPVVYEHRRPTPLIVQVVRGRVGWATGCVTPCALPSSLSRGPRSVWALGATHAWRCRGKQADLSSTSSIQHKYHIQLPIEDGQVARETELVRSPN